MDDDDNENVQRKWKWLGCKQTAGGKIRDFYTSHNCIHSQTHMHNNLHFYSIIIQHFIYFIISDLGNTVLTTQQTEQENEHARKSCQDENTYREQMISICDTDMCERQTLPI